MCFLIWIKLKHICLIKEMIDWVLDIAPPKDIWIELCLQMISDDDFCKQFGPRSGPSHWSKFTVWHSNCIPERIFWKSSFWEKKYLQQACKIKDIKIAPKCLKNFKLLRYTSTTTSKKWPSIHSTRLPLQPSPGFAQAWKVLGFSGFSWKVLENQICLEKYWKITQKSWKVLEFYYFLKELAQLTKT